MKADGARIDGVRAALAARLGVSPDTLRPLSDTGLAHDHIVIGEGPTLARIPKQSQLDLGAQDNLDYQEACFARASASGHTPRLHDLLAPDAALPMGALIVERIEGVPLSLPNDLTAMAQCLAAIHALPLPDEFDRAPLKDPTDTLTDTFTEILLQSAFIARADLHPESEALIRVELQAVGQILARGGRPPKTLIAFDAHPGNYLRDDDGRAVLVDLEKARYGAPAFDLAHASLYTSTTWDVASQAVLTHADVASFHAAWLAAVPDALASATSPWLLPLRRMMWLWSVTWCTKWKVQSREAVGQAGPGENWSAELSTNALVAHVAERVAHYLDPETIAQVRTDWAEPDATILPATAVSS
jgi:aminoglycoside phosphotransferase (APT) family kinase protein